MKRALYLHGLESKLNKAKRKLLERNGYTVFAPDIIYDKPEMLYSLKNELKEDSFDCVIGSSMGGYVGYFLAKFWDKPCLLFNPAFVNRRFDVDFSEMSFPSTKTSINFIVLGAKDAVIPYEKNNDYIKENLKKDYTTILVAENGEHRIDVELFEKAIVRFHKLLDMPNRKQEVKSYIDSQIHTSTALLMLARE